MRELLLFFMVFTASNKALEELATNTSVSAPSEEAEHCRDGIKDLVQDTRGLEFYLEDKKKFEDHSCDNKACAIRDWEQPKLEKYKSVPKSYLPKNCEGTEE